MVSGLPEQIWKGIWIDFNVDAQLIENLWIKIQKAYSSKGRYYHTLRHIEQILHSIDNCAKNIGDLKTMQLAAFYHDIVYSSQLKDNEEQSVLEAEKDLKLLNYPSDLIGKCSNYILATKSHINLLNDSDLNLFLDFDLEKLGATWFEYQQYTHQIRQEYKIYPDIIYKPGRRKVLEHFLNLDNIFKTPEFREKYEQNARQNITKELEMLK